MSGLRVPSLPLISPRKTFLMLLALLLVLLLSACNSQTDEAIDTDGDDDPDAWRVTFYYDGESYIVNMDDLETVQHPDETDPFMVIPLTAAYEASGIDKPVDALWFNFESSDGYSPLVKSNCDGLVPVKGDLIDKAFVEVDTRRLHWASDLGYPGCMSVKDIAHVHVYDSPDDVPDPVDGDDADGDDSDGDSSDGDDADGDDLDGDDADGDDSDGDDTDGDDADGDDSDGDDTDGDDEFSWNVIFKYNGQDFSVDVTDLETMTYNDGTNDLTVVQLLAAFAASSISVHPDALLFNFEAEDGFGPLDSPNCAGLVPVSGSLLGQGYLNLASKRLIWDSTLGFPGCMSVRDLKYVLVVDAPPAPWIVTFHYAGDEYPVTVDGLETMTYSTGEDDLTVVQLSTAFTASGITADLDSLQFNFETSDGYDPQNAANCTGFVPVSGDVFDMGYLRPDIKRLIWDASLSYPGCLRVSDLAHVRAEDKPAG